MITHALGYQSKLFPKAIRETDLYAELKLTEIFGRRSTGIWYDPQDLTTLFQDAAGTLPVYRPGTGLVDPPVGLMLDKSHGLELGPELWPNGDFSQGATGWALTTTNSSIGTSSVVNGKIRLTKTSSGTCTLAAYMQGVSAEKGYVVSVSYEITEGSGFVAEYGAGGAGIVLPATKTSVVYIIRSRPNIYFRSFNDANALTVDISNISIREIKGYHAYQATTTARPTLSGRYNLLTATETLSTQSVTTVATNYTLRFEGADTITLSGTATGTYSAGTHTVTCTAGTLTCTVAGSVTRADLRRVTGQVLPAYQAVVNANTYDTAGFPLYLKFDKTDDILSLISPTGGLVGTWLQGLEDRVDDTEIVIPAGAYTIPSVAANPPYDHFTQFVAFNKSLTDSEYTVARRKVLSTNKVAETYPTAPLGTIGNPGEMGFGVGICPPEYLPAGMVALTGVTDPRHYNYGNYQYADGSIMCWVPKFFYRENHPDNPTHAAYAPNDIHVVGTETFANRAQAEAAGYVLDRSFIDGGAEKPGWFGDKFKASKNAKGTGWIASSIKGGLPLSSSSLHNPVGQLTATAGINANAAFVTAFKARDGVDGAVNPGSAFHAMSAYQMAALGRLVRAHAQAATGVTHCAWYDPAGLTNFPKGCNNNALRDTNDATVLYESDGYENCGKTGSGVPFARTTHNGQECGFADLNGLINEVLIGMTCIATTKAISGATTTNPCALTVAGHGLTTGAVIRIDSVVGMTQLNGKLYTITVVDPDTITLDGVDATGFTAWASGGSVSFGTFYAAKEATRMADFTAGNSSVTDHWGATGVAAMMDPVDVPMLAEPGGTAVEPRFGNGPEQVFSGAASGNGYVLAGLGLPMAANAISAAGTALFGTDRFHRAFVNELCVLGCGYWHYGANAGVFARYLDHSRTRTHHGVGGRAACYPVSEV